AYRDAARATAEEPLEQGVRPRHSRRPFRWQRGGTSRRVCGLAIGRRHADRTDAARHRESVSGPLDHHCWTAQDMRTDPRSLASKLGLRFSESTSLYEVSLFLGTHSSLIRPRSHSGQEIAEALSQEGDRRERGTWGGPRSRRYSSEE